MQTSPEYLLRARCSTNYFTILIFYLILSLLTTTLPFPISQQVFLTEIILWELLQMGEEDQEHQG